jgi:uncharacterized FlaG/YvyC family protein
MSASDFDPLITRMLNRVNPVDGRYDRQDLSKRKQHQHQDKEERESKDYLRTLRKAAENSNDLLEKKDSPYRFRIYENEGEVFIELLVLDKSGNVINEQVRRITHESFEKWIEDLSAIEGLFLDMKG